MYLLEDWLVSLEVLVHAVVVQMFVPELLSVGDHATRWLNMLLKKSADRLEQENFSALLLLASACLLIVCLLDLAMVAQFGQAENDLKELESQHVVLGHAVCDFPHHFVLLESALSLQVDFWLVYARSVLKLAVERSNVKVLFVKRVVSAVVGQNKEHVFDVRVVLEEFSFDLGELVFVFYLDWDLRQSQIVFRTFFRAAAACQVCSF